MGILSKLFGRERRATIENPAYSLDDPEMWDALMGDEAGASGVHVGPESALKLSPVWRGVFLIARTVGKLPLYVYERDADGEGKHYAINHPAYPLLRRKPSTEVTAFTFKQVVTAQAILMGNGYAYIDRAGDGSPREIIPLPPGSCHPVRVGGILYYVYTAPNGKMDKLARNDVYHIRGPGLDALCGIDLTKKAKDSIGSGLAAQTYAARYFANGAEPRVVFESEKQLAPAQREQIRAMWNTMHAGLENAHKSGIVENGVKIKAFGADPETSQLLETRKFSIIDVSNWLNLPPHKLGETTGKAFASLEQENQAFLDESIDPWLVQHEEESFDKLLTEEQKRTESHTIEFMRLALMRADSAARGALYHAALLDGWMNADEIRARENLNPIPDGNGKLFYRPANMIQVGTEPPPPPEPIKTPATQAEIDPKEGENRGKSSVSEGVSGPDLTQIRAATRRMATDSARRMVKRLAVHARKAAKTPENFAGWLETDLETDHRAVLIEAFAPVAGVASSLSGVDQQAEKVVTRIFDEFRSLFTDRLPTVTTTTIDAAMVVYEATAPDAIVALLNYGDPQ